MTYDLSAGVIAASSTPIVAGVTDVHAVALAMRAFDGIVLTGVEDARAGAKG